MATLIQSKQIQGVVTASVISGDFTVGGGGSVNLSEASGVSGSFSGSYQGDGSLLTGISYSNLTNLPTLFSGSTQIDITQTDGFTAFSSSIATSIGNITDTDDQTLTFNQASKELTISEGNTVDLSSLGGGGGGSNESLNSFTASYYTDSSSFDSRIVGISVSGSGADWNTNLQNIPSGIISGSIQILGGTDIISSSAQISSLGFLTSSHTDISSLNDYTASNDLRLTNLESTTSSLDTRITQLSDTTGSYETIGRGIISSSEQFPSGIVSSSVQILGGTGILSGSHSDLSSLNTYTSSTDERLSNIEAATGSYLTSETDSQTLSISGDQLTISSGNVVTIPTGSSAVEGTISGSQQISDLGFISSSHTDVTHLNTFTSSIQTEVDALSAATSSYLTSETDSQTLSISGDQLTISSGNTITIPSGSSGTTDYTQLTNVPSGLVSGSSQVDYDVLTGGKGLLSGSHTDISSLNDYTSSTDTRLSGIDSITSSLEQRVSEIESNTGSYDDLTNITHLNTFTSSYYTDSASFDTQISTEKGRIDNILSGANADYDQFVEIVNLVNSTDTENDTAFANHYTSSRQRLTALETFTSSIDTSIKSKLDSDGVFSGSLVAGENITINVDGSNYIISSSASGGSSNVTVSDSAPSSPSQGDLWWKSDDGNLYVYYDGYWVISLDTTSTLPSGVISGSSQLTSSYDTRYSLSGSSGVSDYTDLTNIPANIISGSQQITDLGFISSSHTVIDSLNTFTSSIQTEVNAISAQTSSYLTELPDGLVSGSVLRTLGGTGVLSGSKTDISSLNVFTSSIQTEVDGLSTFTSSIQTEVDVLSAATSSYLTSETDSQTLSIDGNELTISSGNSITLPSTSLPSGVISGSSQLTSSYDARYVINQAPTAEFTNHTTNFNTNLATSGKTMVSMSVSDSEGNSPYSASLSGTDGSSFDLVYSNDASSSIGIHAGSNLSAANYSYNVTIFDSFDKFTTYSRTLEVTQADVGTLNGDTTSYIIESANNGATIRDASGFGGGNASQVSVSYSPNHGSQVLSSFTSSNPAVLIDSSGNLTMGLALRGSTTGSGDSIVSNITFTDQYSNVGNSNVTINVFANNHPSASISDISGDLNINEATSGTDLVNVTITDTESDTPFSASLSGTHASSFQLQYNNSNSSSIDIQAASDLSAQTYSYTLDIFDNFGKTSSYDRTLTIADANVGTLSTNGTFYIIESATSGNAIRLNSNGRTGTQGDLSVSYSPNYGSQTCSEFTSSNALIAVNSSGNLSVGSNISGSGETSGDTITSNITFADQYGNVGSGSISVNVTTNNAPDIIFSNSSRLNTNQATGSSGTLTTLSFSDTESDSVDYDNLTFTDSSGQLTATQNSNTWLVTANSQLSASNYTFSAAIEDEHHFRTNTESHTITIVQSGNGTMTGDSSVYIIESAESGDPFRDATGFGNGNTAQIGASYSPSNGSPTIQSFTSSNPAILVDGSGNLTLGVDISGSVTQSGDTINSDITFTDQYGNVGSGSVTATVFGNNSPVATFTATSNYETDNATNGSTAGTLSISDTESNSPFTITLGGTHASSFQVSGTNILANTTLSAGTYTINITVTDTYSESVTLSNQTITVTTSQDFGKIYIYYSNYGTDAGFSSNYNAVMGASTVNSDTPPEVTAYTGNTASPYYKFKSGDIGSTSISLAGSKNATLAAVVSGSNLNSAISESAAGMSWATGVQSIILFPSGSDMGGIPSSMTDGFGGSTVGEYVILQYLDGTGAPLGAAGSVLHSIVLDSALHGYSEWFILGVIGQASASTMRLKVLPASGSLEAF
jgi:hypothetical protein